MPNRLPSARRNHLIYLLLFIGLLAGCSATPQTRQLLHDVDTLPIATQRELGAVPFYPQEAYQCGPAALATLLQYSGIEVSPDELVPQVYVPEREGSFQVEMLAATRHYQRLAYVLKPSLAELLASVDAGQPVLVLQNLGLDWYQKWHYAVVAGYDLQRGKILLRSGLIERYEIDMTLFERTWKRGHYWGMVVLRPGQLPARPDPHQYLLATAAFEHFAASADSELAWRTGVQRWPQATALLMGYGNFQYGRQRFAAAAALYRRVLSVDEQYAPAWNNLAQVMLDTRHYREAVEYAARAVSLGGSNAELYRQTYDEARRLAP